MWFVDPDQKQSVNITGDGLVVDAGSTGQYADMPGEQEKFLIEQLSAKPWRQVVEEMFRAQNPWLYRIITDSCRAMPLELLKLPENSACLDVGSGYGQLSIPMAKRGGRVVCLDLAANRLRALAQIARQEKVSLELALGNILTFPFREGIFDLVLMNGVLEWVGIGRTSDISIRDCQLQALRRLRNLLKLSGQIYLAIENSVGLKYLLGARDDHDGTKYGSFSHRPEDSRQAARVWNLKEYEQLFSQADLKVRAIYGCFPDYKLPKHMIPLEEIDRFLGGRRLDWQEYHGDNGQILDDQQPLQELYSQLASLGLARWFCPSYAFILEPADA